MTIEKKLKTAIAIPVIIFLILAGVAYFQVRQIGVHIKRATEIEIPRCEAVTKMGVSLIGMGFELLGYLQDHQQDRLEYVQSYQEQFYKYHIVYSSLADDERTRQLVDVIDRSYSQLKTGVEEILNLEEYLSQRLSVLHSNFEKIDELTDKGFEENISSLDANSLDRLKIIFALRIKTDNMEEDLGRYLITHHQQKQRCREKLYYEDQDETSQLIAACKKLSSHPPQSLWLSQLESLYTDNAHLIKEIVALSEKKEANLEKFIGIRNDLQTVLEVDAQRTHANFDIARRASYKIVKLSSVIIPGVAILGLVVVLICQAYLTATFSSPIRRLKEITEDISRGKYDTIGMDTTYLDNEIGQLARLITEIAEMLKTTSNQTITSSDKHSTSQDVDI